MIIDKYQLTAYDAPVKVKCFTCECTISNYVVVPQKGDNFDLMWVCETCKPHAQQFVDELNQAYRSSLKRNCAK